MKAIIKKKGANYRGLFDIQVNTDLIEGLANFELTEVDIVLDHLPFEGKHIPLIDLVNAYTALDYRKRAADIENATVRR